MKPIAVELTFDSASNQRLTGAWEHLSGLYGGPTESELGICPHLTLALFREREPRGLNGIAAQLASRIGRFALDLATVSRFPGSEGVVFLAPSPSTDLLRAHAITQDLLGDDRDRVDAFYQPGAWHPHCTMALNVPDSQIEAVLVACSMARGPVSATRVQVVRFRPATLIEEASLHGSA